MDDMDRLTTSNVAEATTMTPSHCSLAFRRTASGNTDSLYKQMMKFFVVSLLAIGSHALTLQTQQSTLDAVNHELIGKCTATVAPGNLCTPPTVCCCHLDGFIRRCQSVAQDKCVQSATSSTCTTNTDVYLSEFLPTSELGLQLSENLEAFFKDKGEGHDHEGKNPHQPIACLKTATYLPFDDSLDPNVDLMGAANKYLP